jgi:hypothetical protein
VWSVVLVVEVRPAHQGTVIVSGRLAGLWLKRKLRLRMRSASWAALAGRAHQATTAHLHPRARWWWSRPVPNRHWVAATLARRRLWRAVTAAEHAVAQARKTGAPTGDLNSLCQRLRQTAAGTDRSLAIAGRAIPPGAPPARVSSQAADLVAAAGRIQDAAASSAASVSQSKVASLADDVRQEVIALSAGWPARHAVPARQACPGSLRKSLRLRPCGYRPGYAQAHRMWGGAVVLASDHLPASR